MNGKGRPQENQLYKVHQENGCLKVIVVLGVVLHYNTQTVKIQQIPSAFLEKDTLIEWSVTAKFFSSAFR